MKKILILSCLFAGILYFTVFIPVSAEKEALSHIPEPSETTSALRFVSNQGQWEAFVRYRVRLNGGDLFFTDNAITYSLYNLPIKGHEQEGGHHDQSEEQRFKGHVFRMKFAGGNPAPNIRPELKYPEYHNYFLGNDPTKWAGGVPLFGLLTYEAVYPGVDFRMYGSGDALKYDFVLQAGADPDQIQIQFEGIENIDIKNGELVLETSVRTIREMAPVAYQLIHGQRVEVACKFVLRKSVLKYAFPKGYDPAYPLVIDPTLIFSTYTGSFSDNWGFTATYDTTGNAYAGGIQWGANIGSGYPTTVGAFDRTFNGGQSDVTIAKLSPNGNNLIYSTFLGGTNYDQPHSLIVGANNELIVMGRTSSINFPTQNGADNTHNGGYDIFVTRFSIDGTALIGSTFLGGNNDDGVNGDTDFTTYTNTKYNYGDDARGEVIIDAADNIIIAAPTRSANFPIIGAAFQPNKFGGQDGCIVKLSPNLNNIIWSSFFGGSGEDAIHTVKTDGQGNLFIAGGTTSGDLSTTPGVIQTSFSGDTDGFIAKINGNGTNIINCTYLGTASYDQVYLLDLDKYDQVYVAGQTSGNWAIVSPAAGPIYVNSGAKQFVNKLENDLSGVVYSTTIGSTNSTHPNISPTAFLVDRCEHIYLTGWGGVTSSGTGSPNQGNTFNMPVTGDAYKSTTDGSDFYMIVLDRDAQNLLYGSYFGGTNATNGDHVDGGTSRFDKEGVVYHAVCASCGGTQAFPAQPGGVVGPVNNSPNCNLAVFKMAFDLSGVEARFIPRDSNNLVLTNTEGCAPLLVNFDNRSIEPATGGVVSYFWDFMDNGATSTDVEPTYIFQTPGTYDVMLVITDSASCNIHDTTFRTIIVHPRPAVDAGPNQTVCRGDTFQLSSQTVGVSYEWTPQNNFITSANIPNPQGVASITTDYTLTLTDNRGCMARDLVRIEVDTSFRVQARSDSLICRGGSFQLSGSGNGVVSYLWSSSPLANISDPTISNPNVNNLDTTTVFYLTAENAIGCKAEDSTRIEVFEVFTLEDTFVCDGSSIVLTSSNGVSFSWAPNNGTLDDPNIASPTATPSTNTTYTVTATSSEGCISVKDVLVEVRNLPVADAGPDISICFGEDTLLSGSGDGLYSWTPANGLSNPTIANPIANPDSTTQYYFTVTDTSGCSASDSLTITVNPLPIVSVGPDTTICEGEAVQLQASGATNYVWSPPTDLSNPLIANPLATPTQSLAYEVVGTDNNGCENSDFIQIDLVPRPVTVVDGVNRLCVGGSIELTASGGNTYIWNTGDSTATISVSPQTPTTYIAQAVVGGCVGFPDSITVDAFFDYPQANFNFDAQPGYAPQEVQFNNTSTGADSYLWNFGIPGMSREESPLIKFPSAGEHTITLIAYSPEGCPDTLQAIIFLDNVTLHVPSGFTPNFDDVNNEFYIGYVGIKTLNVKIFSRWGVKIFESDNPDFRWDGTYKGEEVPEGVYVYVITGLGENDVTYKREGTVTLIR